MSTKRRKYNPNIIRSCYTYTLLEIAETFKVHVRTAQSWHKDGMTPIDENLRPYLFMGEAIKDYLKAKRIKNKFKLGIGEFNCNKCRQPRKSIPSEIQIINTGRNLGKKYKQIIMKGICEVCKTKLIRFSSDRLICENELKITEHGIGLNGNEHSYINTDLERNNELAQNQH